MSPFKQGFKGLLKGFQGEGFEVLDVFVVFVCVLHGFSLRPGSTVHGDYGFFPPQSPGQNLGQQDCV